MDTNRTASPLPNSQLLNDASRFVETCGPADAWVARGVADALKAVRELVITVTFGGHFKAGKSKLINALLDRTILPVSGKPETGVSCRIGTGSEDAGLVQRAEGEFAIPVNEDGVRRESRLIGTNGEPRSELAAIREVRLTLKDAPLDANVQWIDPPGLNDIEEMDRRLREAAAQADLLVWVMNSQAVLSEVEQRYLAEYVAARGPSSLVFVLNVFVHENPAKEWNRFLIESSATLLNRVHRFAQQVSAPQSALPLVFVASAAGMSQDFEQFGGTRLREFLGGSAALTARVAQARHDRLALAIGAAYDAVHPQATVHRTHIDTERTEVQKRRQDMERRVGEYRGAVADLLRNFINVFTAEARRTASAAAAAVRPAGVRFDSRVAAQLANDLRTYVAHQVVSLDEGIRNAARRSAVAAPTAQTLQNVAAYFHVPDPQVSVPVVEQNAVKGAFTAIAVTILVTIVLMAATNDGCAQGLILMAGLAVLVPVAIVGAARGSKQKGAAEVKQADAVHRGIIDACERIISTFVSCEEPVLQVLTNAAQEVIAERSVDSVAERLLQLDADLGQLRSRAAEATTSGSVARDAPPNAPTFSSPSANPSTFTS